MISATLPVCSSNWKHFRDYLFNLIGIFKRNFLSPKGSLWKDFPWEHKAIWCSIPRTRTRPRWQDIDLLECRHIYFWRESKSYMFDYYCHYQSFLSLKRHVITLMLTSCSQVDSLRDFLPFFFLKTTKTRWRINQLRDLMNHGWITKYITSYTCLVSTSSLLCLRCVSCSPASSPSFIRSNKLPLE